jgi:subtilisin family serine protease
MDVSRSRSRLWSISLIAFAVGCSAAPSEQAQRGRTALATSGATRSQSVPVGRSIAAANPAVSGAIAPNPDGRGAPVQVAVGDPDPVVNVLVELTGNPAATVYQAAMASRGASAASTASVNQLSANMSEQVAFTQRLGAASVPGVKEIYRLQRLYNGIAYVTRQSNVDALKKIQGVKAVHRLTLMTIDNAYAVPFVNVPQLWVNAGLPVQGDGIKVGVIDTGIDYTHANFGGTGTVTRTPPTIRTSSSREPSRRPRSWAERTSPATSTTPTIPPTTCPYPTRIPSTAPATARTSPAPSAASA